MSSVLCTREHVPYVGFVPFSREHVLSSESYLVGLRATFGDGECFLEGSDDSSRADTPETTSVLGFSMVGSRPVSSSPGHGVMGQTSPPFRIVLGVAAASSGLSIGPDPGRHEFGDRHEVVDRHEARIRPSTAPLSSDPSRHEVSTGWLLGGLGWG